MLIFSHLNVSHISVSTICLPEPREEFDDKIVIAAGWGRFAPHHQNESQSTTLQMVSLKVSPKRYSLHKMFGTYLGKGRMTMGLCRMFVVVTQVQMFKGGTKVQIFVVGTQVQMFEVGTHVQM